VSLRLSDRADGQKTHHLAPSRQAHASSRHSALSSDRASEHPLHRIDFLLSPQLCIHAASDAFVVHSFPYTSTHACHTLYYRMSSTWCCASMRPTSDLPADSASYLYTVHLTGGLSPMIRPTSRKTSKPRLEVRRDELLCRCDDLLHRHRLAENLEPEHISNLVARSQNHVDVVLRVRSRKAESDSRSDEWCGAGIST